MLAVISKKIFHSLGLGSLFTPIHKYAHSALTNIWPRSNAHHFASLPTEVLAEILKNADWCDLLTIRRVCKRFNEISNLKAVWESQYKRYVAEKTFMPAIEEPLQSYSSEELEKWVLNRRSADLAWRLDGQFPRERKLEIPRACSLALVPGGRWLLAVMPTGSLNSYDLDQDEVISKQLTRPHDSPQFMYRISIDMNCMALLSFNVVIYSHDNSREFHIYKVDLEGHGSKAQLRGTFLKSFQAPASKAGLPGFLCGDLFAQCTGQCVEIFNWRLSTSMEHHKTVVYLGVKVSMIQLLPNNRLIVYSLQILIYALDAVQKVEPSIPSPQDPTRPQWKSRDNYSFVAYRYLGVSSASDIVILTSKQMFYQLIIPHNRMYDPHLSEPVEMAREFRWPLLGSEKVLVREGKGLTKIGLRDLKPETTTGLGLSSFVTSVLSQRQLIGYFIPMLLDEQCGRILLYIKDQITILDTALCPLIP